MSLPNDTMTTTPPTDDDRRTVYRQYPANVRIVVVDQGDDAGSVYRFEAPDHIGMTFEDPETATLYADVYFSVNGFVEADTGDRGIPPAVVQAGKDTLAAYLVTQTSVGWVASFYGKEPVEIEQYLSWVRDHAADVRDLATGDADSERPDGVAGPT